MLSTYTSMSPQPKPEIARTKFKLSQALQAQGSPLSHWEGMREEARVLLSRILDRDSQEIDSESEEVYDSCIAYFLR